MAKQALMKVTAAAMRAWKHFAFSLPPPNFQRPYRRYQWKVFPQGMKNSPTLCQKFADIAILQVHKIYSEIYLVHYMGDIPFSHKDRAQRHRNF